MDAPYQAPGPGAVLHDEGAHFSVVSRHAHAVELCLYDPRAPDVELARLPMRHGEQDLWSLDVPGLRAGALYGYRVHGDARPALGHAFDPSKLLIDPWARATTGSHRWHPSQQPGGGDSAAYMPRSVLIDPRFDWLGDRPPGTAWADTLLYEAHVKGMTARHPDVPPEQRGRYLGLASPPIVEHLQRLGVTALQLLPVQQAWDERHLVERGLTNYWGYAPIAPFAPDGRFASGSRGEQVSEFREMVRRLHAVGIEVLLDVVFNHSAEGGDGGPLLSLRGLDNPTFYRLHPSDPARGVDWTGCGNTLDVREPQVRRWILDCLRWWVREMHVDGFRFDLGVTLDRSPGFVAALAADPALRGVKLIAEPWDLGPDGYRLGRFGAPWVEWNDRFRDAARRVWRGDPGVLPELATRLAGSSDVFEAPRGPLAGINYVACHDGFTLADLCSYRRKHNEANGEANRDGTDANHSTNGGVEGATTDPAILATRERIARNLLATVALAQGVPMLGHGDELGRSQGGNNNAYCQDSPLSWVDWSPSPRRDALLTFTRLAFGLRRQCLALRGGTFFSGEADDGGERDVVWSAPSGAELQGADWAGLQGFAMRLRGAPGSGPLLALINPSDRPLAFALPAEPGGWQVRLGTGPTPPGPLQGGIELPAGSLLWLQGSGPGGQDPTDPPATG
mgnify:CR=1 FL=1